MQDDRRKLVEEIVLEAARLHEEAARQAIAPVLAAAAALETAFASGAHVLVFGNGGSAADAQHLAAEMVWRLTRKRRALPVIALTTDTSILTAVSNDERFDVVFSRQIEALGRPGDVAWAISTSGASPNVVSGLQAARLRGLKTVAFTGGDGGAVGSLSLADVHVNVPHPSAARVQEVHRTLIHAVCELVERTISDEERRAASA